MSQLYTVRMLRKRTIYSYDPHTGLRVNERDDSVEVTVCDLPMRTALAYKFKFPANDPVITPQEGAVEIVHFSETRNYYDRDDRDEAAPAKDHYVTPAVVVDALVSAAITGDMAAAISGEAA